MLNHIYAALEQLGFTAQKRVLHIQFACVAESAGLFTANRRDAWLKSRLIRCRKSIIGFEDETMLIFLKVSLTLTGSKKIYYRF